MTRACTRTRFTSGSQRHPGTSWPAAWQRKEGVSSRHASTSVANAADGLRNASGTALPLFFLSLSHTILPSLSLCFSFPLHHSPTLFALVLICDKSSLTCVQLGNLAARCEDPFALESVAALAQQHIRHCTTTTQRHTHIDTLTSNYFEACAAICQTSLELSLSERRVWQPRDRRTCMTYGRYS